MFLIAFLCRPSISHMGQCYEWVGPGLLSPGGAQGTATEYEDIGKDGRKKPCPGTIRLHVGLCGREEDIILCGTVYLPHTQGTWAAQPLFALLMYSLVSNIVEMLCMG